MGAGGDRRARQQAKVNKMESRDRYSQHWQSPLMETCPSAPGFFCFAMWCPWCASYSNRKKALHGDMSRYICCNGDCPCSGKMKEQDCPEFCLCVEVCVCFAQSVASTRWLLQDRLAIRNTKCDNCLIGTMICLQYADCICSLLACLTDNELIDMAAECVDCAADIAWCTVCACMQTQARHEMRENPRWTGAGAGGGAHMAAPPQQQMAYPGGGGGGYGHGKHNQPPPPQAMQHPGGGGAPPPGYPAAAQGYGPPPGQYGGHGGHGGPPPGYPSN